MHQQIKLIRLLVPMVVCLGLAPMAQAVGPDTDGAIAGSNNGEGIGVLVNRTSGVWNTGTGYQALNQLTTGGINTATGLRALFNTTTGFYNTATGVYSLFGNVNGNANTANGWQSLVSNIDGFGNVAMGARALASNTSGGANTAIGTSALVNSTASQNTAVGAYTLNQNTTGFYNVAVGSAALANNNTGNGNTANGVFALINNTTGTENTANGAFALNQNTFGNLNTANGVDALNNNTTGSGNTAVGYQALAFSTGNANIALGNEAGTDVFSASNVIAIGKPGQDVSNTCYIGNIFGVTSAGATAVYVNSLGKLGTVVSSRRFKDEIQPMDKASEAILALKPVSFRYKQEIDPGRSPQFGLVAEDVEKVNPDLVVRDAQGKVNTVRYEAVNAMLLNEFLKEHRMVEELKNDFQTTVAQQQKEIQALTAQLKEQATQIQKVSAQFEMSRPAARTVLSNR
jgi:hypothetical protein